MPQRKVHETHEYDPEDPVEEYEPLPFDDSKDGSPGDSEAPDA